MTPRPGLRRKLVQAAARRFARDGEAGLTMRGVAAEAGCALRSVYLHFADREALRRAVLAARLAGLADELESVERHGKPGEARLLLELAAIARLHDEERDGFRALFDWAIARGTPPAEAEALGVELERVLDVFARELAALVGPRARPERERALSLLSMAYGQLAMRDCVSDDPDAYFERQMRAGIAWLAGRSSPSRPQRRKP